MSTTKNALINWQQYTPHNVPVINDKDESDTMQRRSARVLVWLHNLVNGEPVFTFGVYNHFCNDWVSLEGYMPAQRFPVRAWSYLNPDPIQAESKSVPAIDQSDDFNKEQEYSKRVVVMVDDQGLAFPFTTGKYLHRVDEWVLAGFSGTFSKKVKAWQEITEPVYEMDFWMYNVAYNAMYSEYQRLMEIGGHNKTVEYIAKNNSVAKAEQYLRELVHNKHTAIGRMWQTIQRIDRMRQSFSDMAFEKLEEAAKLETQQ